MINNHLLTFADDKHSYAQSLWLLCNTAHYLITGIKLHVINRQWSQFNKFSLVLFSK